MFKPNLIMGRSRPRRSVMLPLLILTLASLSTGLAPPALVVSLSRPAPDAAENAIAESAKRLYNRDNLIAWCIVPFDSKKRGPEERATMLQKLGLTHFAYDWRAEHIPSFDAEVEALDAHGVALDAFWVSPGELNRESRIILDLLKRHGKKAQLWVLLDLGNDRVHGAEQDRRVETAALKFAPWPKRLPRSVARWRSTITVAGSASPRIRSPSSNA